MEIRKQSRFIEVPIKPEIVDKIAGMLLKKLRKGNKSERAEAASLLSVFYKFNT